MPLTIGPSAWWLRTKESINYYAKCCPVGTTLPDGSKIICKAGGTAWIVAPASTQVSMAWAGGQYNSTLVGDKCCISEWSTLQNALIAGGFNPTDWFVPNITQLSNPGYNCKTQWDSCSSAYYWSSTETGATYACCVLFNNGNANYLNKANTYCVRAFRCVTY
jgi:hypothetical protein